MANQQFSGVKVAIRVKDDDTVDIAFGNLPLTQAADFFSYLGTDAGQDELGETIIVALLDAGAISLLDALYLIYS